MFGRSLGPGDKPCTQTIIGLPLAPIWGSGLGLISAPFWRRFQDSFWRSFGASEVSQKVAKRYTLRSKKEATIWVQNTKESNEEGGNQSRAERNLPRFSPNLESFRCTLLRCLGASALLSSQRCLRGDGGRRFRRNYGSWTDACGRSWSCRVSHPKDVV